MWQVPFEPGTLKAISRKKGKTVLVKEIKTAGQAASIHLLADRNIIHPDGQDLAFITVRILDKQGNPVPYANNLVNFSIEGNGTIAAVDNGFPASTESFHNHYCKAYNGLCLVVIRPGNKSGDIKLTASSDGLQAAHVSIHLK